jgi:hypothetical protein
VRSAEEVRAEDSANWKKYNQIKDEIKSTGAEVTRLAHELKALFDKQPNAQVQKLFNQANVPVSAADRTLATLDLNRMQDVFAVGPGAIQKFREGLALLRKARALYK